MSGDHDAHSSGADDHPGARRTLRWIRISLVLSASGLAAVLFAFSTMTSGDSNSEDFNGALEVEFALLDGPVSTLRSSLRGPIIVNFFASWCAPCLSEMPDFEAFHQAHRGEVTIVGLSLSEDRDTTARVVAQTAVTYRIGLDSDGHIFELFEGVAMPTTVFIDADGSVIRKVSGRLSLDALETLASELFAIELQ